MSYFSDLHIIGQAEGHAGMHAQLVRDLVSAGRTATEAHAAADRILAPKPPLTTPILDDESDSFDDEDAGYDRYYGTPCAPKCQMCGRAMDECSCFGGDLE